MYDLGIINGKVYRGGDFYETNVYIESGEIVAITGVVFPAKETLDASGLWILPGLIDPHVHLELNVGDYTSCDTFESGGYEAALGGITTVIDFLDPISSEAHLDTAIETRKKLALKCPIDYGFHATLGNFQGNIPNLVGAVKEKGLLGIKVFMTYSESNRMIASDDLRALLASDVLTLVHAEDDRYVDPSHTCIETYEDSRPIKAELSAIDALKQNLGKGTLYVVHVSSGSGVEALKGHERIFIETCPQYFMFDKSVFKSNKGGKYLLAPPFRSCDEKQKLRNNFHAIHTIGTDHCPFKPVEKLNSDNASKIPKGVGGLRYSFLTLYGLFGLRSVEKMSKNVAEIFNLQRKGRVAVGYDADLMIFDPNGTTHTGQIPAKYCSSIYENMTFEGAIIHTLSRGTFVVKDGMPQENMGRFIRGGYHDGHY